ncbi:helix-turn-helix domain-containing protein [Deinococcus sp. NW-56]|uniref:helix-turn-helix domain-containing protein n=1 Tax=Deinococcus sp. NW-56 TaxID=2080419 RepID=UPI000CF43E5D|nr:helix-turn-helix domain-containing protein [Deinococcus sp. NW-56]
MNEPTQTDVHADLQQERHASPLPELLTVNEVAALLRVGRNRVYELAHHQHIPTIRLGKGYRFPRRKLLEWIDLQAGAHAQG